MIHVPYRPYVHVRLRSIKLFLRHNARFARSGNGKTGNGKRSVPTLHFSPRSLTLQLPSFPVYRFPFTGPGHFDPTFAMISSLTLFGTSS
jgi:hypothetical protein